MSKAILPKKNRNLGDRKAAVIYRRGVRVREFESSDTESLFDYNLNDLTIDESRKATDWDVKHHCGKALANADKTILAMLFDRLLNSDKGAGSSALTRTLCSRATRTLPRMTAANARIGKRLSLRSPVTMPF